MEHAKLGGYCNYSPERLAALTLNTHSIRSVRRWIQENRAPALVVAWLDLIHYGKLHSISEAWSDWRLYRGVLHAPNGWTFAPSDLLNVPGLYQEIAALRKELRERSPQLELLPTRWQLESLPRRRASA